MIASGEAPIRSTAGALRSPATSVISSFIAHCYPLKRRDTVFDSSFLASFAPFLFPFYPYSKLSRLREALRAAISKNAGCPVLPGEDIGLDVIQAPKPEPRIVRDELTGFEWAGIVGPRVPDAVRRPLRCSAEPGPN
jgi:hypothetical protein